MSSDRRRIDPASEAVILLGAGRAILLQLAEPGVGHGVARHSDFASNPMGRLHGTLMYVYAVMAGTDADRANAVDYVSRMHAPVHGPGPGDETVAPYDANDEGLQLWVAATLYDTAVTVHSRVLGNLPEAEADRLYARYAALGTALRVPPGDWPADRAAFREYWNGQVGRLRVDGIVRAQADALWAATKAPGWVRILMPVVKFVTAGLLPPSVRDEYRLAWSARRQRRFDLFWRVTVALYPRLPRRMRTAPERYYLRRLRRTVAGRPDRHDQRRHDQRRHDRRRHDRRRHDPYGRDQH